LPTINGIQQLPGYEYSAKNVYYKVDDKKAEIKMDIAKAYPNEANVSSWIRDVTLIRGENITISEEYNLKETNGEIMLNLLTPSEVLVNDGLIILKSKELSDNRSSGSAQIHYDSDKLSVSVEKVTVDDRGLKNIWGDQLTRIMLKSKNSLKEETLKLMVTA